MCLLHILLPPLDPPHPNFQSWKAKCSPTVPMLWVDAQVLPILKILLEQSITDQN